MRSQDATPTGRTARRGEAGARHETASVAADPSDPPLAVAVTAEIPAVGGGPDQARQRDGFPRGPKAKRRRRAPAPFAVRVVVWTLFFLAVLAGAGLWAEHSHPSWFTFLRNKVPGAAGAPPSTLPGAATSSSAPGASRLGQISSTATSATFGVPAGGYSVVLTLTSGHPCYMRILSPAGSSTVAFVQTVLANESPKAVPLSGSATVELAASAASITIQSGGKTIETIPTPKILPFHYDFEPVTG